MLAGFIVSASLAWPAHSYDYPLSSEAIRSAYFLGKRQTSLGATFLAEYTHAIPELRAGAFVSEARIETPFFHVAEYASSKLEYHAQDAVTDFLGKPAVTRIFLGIYYKSDAPPNSVKVKVLQNKKEIVPESFESSPFYPATDEYTFIPSVGERIHLEFKPEKFDSSDLTILIDTPDGQHAKCQFDLQALR
jgi:hypothetical protein